MIDIHTHLLPGVDDGSPSIDVSLRVLERFAEQGVEVVVCTPHLDASRAHEAPYTLHAELLEELSAQAPPPISLRLGWEIMLDAPGVDFTDRRLHLGGSGAVLVEFPLAGVPPRATQELWRLRAAGLVPVLAHPERYRGCTPAHVREWRSAGVVIQLDGAGLLGHEAMARLARDLLEEGLVDIIASDNHGDDRTLAAAREWLDEVDASEAVHLLTKTNAERLLAGEMVLPVPPVRVETGWVARLRSLVLGRRG